MMLFVPHLFFLKWPRRVVLRDCGISSVFLFTFKEILCF